MVVKTTSFVGNARQIYNFVENGRQNYNSPKNRTRRSKRAVYVRTYVLLYCAGANGPYPHDAGGNNRGMS